MSDQKTAQRNGFLLFQEKLIKEFRENGGRVGGMFADARLCLLTTIGARTGRPRTSLLGYLEVDGQPVVVASANGNDRHPAWYHNLRKNPRVLVEVGTTRYAADATVASGADRDRLFARVVELAPGYGDYQVKTKRVIPVVTLHPVPDPRGGQIG